MLLWEWTGGSPWAKAFTMKWEGVGITLRGEGWAARRVAARLEYLPRGPEWAKEDGFL